MTEDTEFEKQFKAILVGQLMQHALQNAGTELSSVLNWAAVYIKSTVQDEELAKRHADFFTSAQQHYDKVRACFMDNMGSGKNENL